MTVRHLFSAAAVCAVLATAAFAAQTQNPPAQPPPSADPYLNDPAAETSQFPLAAPAGKDSNARMVAPPGAVNQGPFDPATWKYGPAFTPPPGAKIWNPAKLKLCGPFAWRDRPDFTCFQAGSETAAIARGVAAELGPFANTQGKPEVGPFAQPPKP